MYDFNKKIGSIEIFYNANRLPITDKMIVCLAIVVYSTAVKGLRVPRGAGALVFISLFTFNLVASG